MNEVQENPSDRLAPDATGPYRNDRSEHEDEVDQSPLPARKTRARAPATDKEPTPSPSKDPQSTNKRDLTDVETSMSPNSAPKAKRLRTMSSEPNTPNQKEIDTAAEEQPLDPEFGEVQLSIATGLPPVDKTAKKMFHISEVGTMRKCCNMAARDFLPEIYAAGFNDDLTVLAFRLQRLDIVPGSMASDEDEEWIAVASASTNIFKKWIDLVKAGSGKNKCPRIQILVLDDRSAEADGTNPSLISRADKKKGAINETMPVPRVDKQSAAAKMREAKKALDAWKGHETANGPKASAAKEPKASASSNVPQDDASAKKLEKAQAETKDLKAENKDLKAVIKQLRKDKEFEIRNLSVELDHAQMQRVDRADEKAELAEVLEQVNKDLTKAEREKAKLMKQVAALTKKLKQAALDD